MNKTEQALKFADHIINGIFEGGDWDGGDLQDLAVQYGLLEQMEMQAPCCDEGCQCAQNGADFPTMCYRKTYLAALSQSEAPAEQPEAVLDERSRFEAAMRARTSALSFDEVQGAGEMYYLEDDTQERWIGWQAAKRDALTQAPQEQLRKCLFQMQNAAINLAGQAPQERAAVTDAEIVERAYAHQSAEICKPGHDLSREEMIAFGRDLLSLAQSSDQRAETPK